MAEHFPDLVELFERSCARYAERPLYGTKTREGWTWTTYREIHEQVERFRGGLASIGIARGDRVGIIADNRVEWVVAAYAVLGLGAAFVPMYQAQLSSERRFILADAAVKAVIVANEAIHRDVESMQLDALAHVIGLERGASDPKSWSALAAHAPRGALSPEPASIACFIYTSGTTGRPKGVLLSHANIASNISAVHEIFTFEPEDRSLSFLPWAHAYGQTCEVHGLLSMGCSVAINDDLKNLIENLAEIRPTILIAVPRIFNRIYASVNQEIEKHPDIVQRIIRTGIAGAIARKHGRPLGPIARLELALDEKVLFAKIRARFGGRLKYAISASATLGRDVAEFVDALGLTVYEGYGLTETSPIVSANFPGHRRFGSVGRVLPGMRVEIDARAGTVPGEGEIVVYGPNVMMGYYGRPEETARALTPDGGLRTGDLGRLDADGFLYVTGRIKEQYKLENGKYVMPSTLEEELKLSPYISNVMIHGDGRAYNVALVALDENAIRAWAEAEDVPAADDLTRDPRVRHLIASELDLHGVGFKSFERPREFALVREDWTVDNGLLTPTLKLKRRELVTRYRDVLETLYAVPGPRIAPPSRAAATR